MIEAHALRLRKRYNMNKWKKLLLLFRSVVSITTHLNRNVVWINRKTDEQLVNSPTFH